MKNTTGIGNIGESVACAYLKDYGYKILDRNVKLSGGELDIVSRSKDGVLVFVEVKTLRGDELLNPEQNYNFQKSEKTKRAAQLFAGKHSTWFTEQKGWRIDLVAVIIKNVLLTDYKKDCVIRHYENVA
jgi:putative endonuclease